MRVGIASDHGGFVLKEQIANLLRDAAYEVVDFGAPHPSPGDDYPDYVIPLARAVAVGTVERGVALCGSGGRIHLRQQSSRCARRAHPRCVLRSSGRGRRRHECIFAWRSGDRAGTGMGIDSDVLEGSLQRRGAPPTQSRQSEGAGNA